jgi:tRNA modification GTPase
MNIIQEFDTITAISTPLGTGGVGVIRISGDKSFEIISKIATKKTFKPNIIAHCWIVDGEKKVDEVIVLPFKNPYSYTGEDVIEIQCHGGVNIVKKILNLVLANGARHAEKGEFTKRAFLNKKMDLSQAEAVADLIHSKTQDFVMTSAKNLSGVLAQKITTIKKSIFEVLSRIVAGIDFPEDVSEPEYDYLISEFEKSISDINSILSTANTSNILRQGVSVAIVGRPNVGKSSLFNTLLNLDRAIVTDIAGTTRDVLKETLDFGIPVTLVDTAGIRDDNEVSKVEEIGIEYSKQSLDEADLVLFLYDASVGMTNEDNDIWELVKNKKNLRIANKIDIQSSVDDSEFDIKISTKTKTGIEELKEKIKNIVCDVNPESLEFSTNMRQQNCLEQAKIALNNALEASKRKELQDLISIDVKSALLALEELTGEVITDEILDNIFENFCIGK